jgi:hypothetical protein
MIHRDMTYYESEYNNLIDEIYTFLLLNKLAYGYNLYDESYDNIPHDPNETRTSSLPTIYEYVKKYITVYNGDVYLILTHIEELGIMEHGCAIRCGWLANDYIHKRNIDDMKNKVIEKLTNDRYIYIPRKKLTPEEIYEKKEKQRIEHEKALILYEEERSRNEKIWEEERNRMKEQGIEIEYRYMDAEQRREYASQMFENLVDTIIHQK